MKIKTLNFEYWKLNILNIIEYRNVYFTNQKPKYRVKLQIFSVLNSEYKMLINLNAKLVCWKVAKKRLILRNSGFSAKMAKIFKSERGSNRWNRLLSNDSWPKITLPKSTFWAQNRKNNRFFSEEWRKWVPSSVRLSRYLGFRCPYSWHRFLSFSK